MTFITTHPHLLSIVLVYHLIQHHQSSNLVLIIFRIKAITHFSYPAWSFQVRNITGVTFASTRIRGMESAFVLLNDVLENRSYLSIHSYISAKRLNFQPPQVYLRLLHLSLKIN